MKILIRKGPGRGTVFDFEQARVAVGRSRDSDVPLLGDLLVSRRHCEIIRQGWHWSIVDVGSLNGTRVNNEPVVRPTILRPGDVILLGNSELVVLGADGAEHTSCSPSTDTLSLVARRAGQAAVFLFLFSWAVVFFGTPF